MSKNNLYDVIIIGAGPSGIFCAYELIRQKPELKILMVEKGRPIEKRVCPKRTTKVCVGCKPCSITTGFAGAGAFSDGKLSLSPDVGGNLPEILGTVHRANRNARVCVSAIALETLQTAAAELGKLGYSVEVTQISVSRTRAAGELHLLMAQNPVFLITGVNE